MLHKPEEPLKFGQSGPTHSWPVWYEREPPPLTAYVKRTSNINEADAYKWNMYTWKAQILYSSFYTFH